MRTSLALFLTTALLTACSTAVRTTPSRATSAEACTKATTACMRWITYGGGPARSLVYASHPVGVRDPRLTRALVMVHGAGRNADHYFETAMAAAFLAGGLENTIVIAPRLTAARDSAHAHEVIWPEGRNSWRAGGVSPSNPALTSFAFMDTIVMRLADKSVFPNLVHVVIAGHSAGGQLATRYGMTNRVHDTPGIRMSYVVANPSSYAWPTAIRPLPVGDADTTEAYKEALGLDGEKVSSDFTFGPFDAGRAPDYNRWPSGLDDIAGYAAGSDPEQLRRQLVARPTTYLLGQVDVLPLGGFDSSANAMAQGPTRRARGEAFFKYVNEVMGANHRAIVVSECGHNNRCVFTTDVVLPVIFP